MEQYTLIGEIVAGLAYLLMGMQLIRLSLQTRHVPERLLSATLLSWGLSYLVYDAFIVFAGTGASIPNWVEFSSVLVMYIGSIFFTFFTRSVFRGREGWASWLAAAITIGILTGLLGCLWNGDWKGGDLISNPWYWPKWACGAAPMVWMGVEGFSHYIKARQRRKLGLCEPLDCNRYLLWGMAGVLWAALELVVIAQDFVYQRTGAWSETVGLAVCGLEIVPVILIWLVFYPPARYRRWFNQSTRVEL